MLLLVYALYCVSYVAALPARLMKVTMNIMLPDTQKR